MCSSIFEDSIPFGQELLNENGPVGIGLLPNDRQMDKIFQWFSAKYYRYQQTFDEVGAVKIVPSKNFIDSNKGEIMIIMAGAIHEGFNWALITLKMSTVDIQGFSRLMSNMVVNAIRRERSISCCRHIQHKTTGQIHQGEQSTFTSTPRPKIRIKIKKEVVEGQQTQFKIKKELSVDEGQENIKTEIEQKVAGDKENISDEFKIKVKTLLTNKTCILF
uniref:Uncharacterized protein n=1 Tax=Ditylenchus dipsaci TaxID=166011 RepID=A0A915CMG4_9BILA